MSESELIMSTCKMQNNYADMQSMYMYINMRSIYIIMLTCNKFKFDIKIIGADLSR